MEAESNAAAARMRMDLTGLAGRVLVKEVNWLGDLVISLPALRAIRAAFATSTLTVLVKKELAGFFDGMTWIDEVMPYTVARGIHGIADRIQIINRIRARHFDLAILFPNSFEAALWATIGGARRRAGFSTDYRGALLTHKAQPADDAMSGHQHDYWLAMIRDTVGVKPIAGAAEMKLEVGSTHQEKMRAWLEANRRSPGAPLIAIAPAAAYGPAKEWPLVRYAALIDLLYESAGAECVLVGAPSERQLCAQVAATTRCDAIIAAGRNHCRRSHRSALVVPGFRRQRFRRDASGGALWFRPWGFSVRPTRIARVRPATRAGSSIVESNAVHASRVMPLWPLQLPARNYARRGRQRLWLSSVRSVEYHRGTFLRAPGLFAQRRIRTT